YFHTVDAHPLRGNPPSAAEVDAKRQLRMEELENMAKDIAARQAALDAAAGVEQTAVRKQLHRQRQTGMRLPAERGRKTLMKAFMKFPV
ncbi:hypothetical protein HMPREF0379_2131, partial [[Eubacterium] yurii subsp. margaretiae ATCC 43715]